MEIPSDNGALAEALLAKCNPDNIPQAMEVIADEIRLHDHLELSSEAITEIVARIFEICRGHKDRPKPDEEREIILADVTMLLGGYMKRSREMASATTTS